MSLQFNTTKWHHGLANNGNLFFMDSDAFWQHYRGRIERQFIVIGLECFDEMVDHPLSIQLGQLTHLLWRIQGARLPSINPLTPTIHMIGKKRSKLNWHRAYQADITPQTKRKPGCCFVPPAPYEPFWLNLNERKTMRNYPFPPILPQPLSTAQSCDYVDQQMFHREKTGPQLRGMAPKFSDIHYHTCFFIPLFLLLLAWYCHFPRDAIIYIYI